MAEGKKYLVGLDVILSGGEQTIIQLQDQGNQVNEIYFDKTKIPFDLKEDPAIRQFMSYAQSKGDNNGQELGKNQKPNRNEDGSYTVNGVKVFLKAPSDLEAVIGMTDDPNIQESFFDSGIKRVERPGFLLQNPKVLKNGLIKPKVFIDKKHLKEKIPMEIGVRMFEVNFPFFNQFVLVNSTDGGEAVYQLKQDVEDNGDETYKHIGEPYFKRLLSNMHDFRGNNRFKNHEYTNFGINPNSLNQYLALNHLLLDPTIKLVVLSGGPSTGKTLFPYLAGLMQTLKKTKIEKSIYDSIYLSRPLVSASAEVGFLPGDLDEKLAPLFENFSGIHSFLDINDKYTFEDTLMSGVDSKLSGTGYMLPIGGRPLVYMKNPGFMRGINIPNAWILYDEFQNFTRHEGKLLITRAAQGSKTIICGDIGQIDNYPICTQDKNALVFATHFHMDLGHPHMGVMHFVKPNRNIISNFSTEMPVHYR